jgi:hypothetical protein
MTEDRIRLYLTSAELKARRRKWRVRYIGSDVWEIIQPNGQRWGYDIGSAASAMLLAEHAILLALPSPLENG